MFTTFILKVIIYHNGLTVIFISLHNFTENKFHKDNNNKKNYKLVEKCWSRVVDDRGMVRENLQLLKVKVLRSNIESYKKNSGFLRRFFKFQLKLQIFKKIQDFYQKILIIFQIFGQKLQNFDLIFRQIKFPKTQENFQGLRENFFKV